MSDVDGMAYAIRQASLEGEFTRRQYMTRRLLLDGANMWRAIEAVNATAMGHPDWDMDEKRTWPEWEAAVTLSREERARGKADG